MRIQDGTLIDIEYSKTCLQEALSCLPRDHPLRAKVLLGITEANQERYTRTKSREDILLSLPILRECWSCQAAPLCWRMRAIARAAVLCGGEEACGLLQDAIEQIPTLCPRSLVNTDKQRILESIADIASSASSDVDVPRCHHFPRYILGSSTKTDDRVGEEALEVHIFSRSISSLLRYKHVNHLRGDASFNPGCVA